MTLIQRTFGSRAVDIHNVKTSFAAGINSKLSPSRARMLFVETEDAASWPVHAELRLLGHEICSISRESEEPAAVAFKPDIMLLDPEIGSANAFRIFELLADDGNRCPVALLQTHPRFMPSVRANAERNGFAVLGSAVLPYATQDLTALLARIPIVPRDHTACDRLLVSRLIQHGRLLPNLTHEFMPKLGLCDNTIKGFETLTRLRNRNSLDPELIFSTSTILSIEVAATLMAFDMSAYLWRALQHKARRTVVASNCSASVLVSTDFADGVSRTMRKHGIPKGAMVIELTEDPRPVDLLNLAAAMTMLAGQGIKFALDDFGKGTANFDRIDTLPVSEVKVDRAMFRACVENRTPRGLLRELVSYCRQKNIVSVIEGIETADDLEVARSVGADHGQGFYWGRPVRASGLGITIPC